MISSINPQGQPLTKEIKLIPRENLITTHELAAGAPPTDASRFLRVLAQVNVNYLPRRQL